MAISAKARVAGVMGWPVGHSLSPRLHGFWLQKYEIDGAYVPMAVAPERIADAIRALPALGFAGANVTVPHKEAALATVDEATVDARAIGAVNTIVVQKDGRLLGTNTDGFGFLANVKDFLPAWTPRGKVAAILGAGGAAKSIAWTLLAHGTSRVFVINRTPERARELAVALGGRATAVRWDDSTAALEQCDLLVNSTTLGMHGQPPLEVDLGPLSGEAVVADIVYAPLQTELLVRAQARGNPVVDGIGMLLHQARPGFAAWFGREPEVTAEVRAFVLAGQ
jgi:shikimate dehydrogenase